VGFFVVERSGHENSKIHLFKTKSEILEHLKYHYKHDSADIDDPARYGVSIINSTPGKTSGARWRLRIDGDSYDLEVMTCSSGSQIINPKDAFILFRKKIVDLHANCQGHVTEHDESNRRGQTWTRDEVFSRFADKLDYTADAPRDTYAAKLAELHEIFKQVSTTNPDNHPIDVPHHPPARNSGSFWHNFWCHSG
jgi:hypothetical protein